MSALIQNGYIIGGGLEIDDSVVSASKLWSSQKISQVISNPNLLDNPWFTVNQRGQSSYGADVMSVDRWRSGFNSQVGVISTGITLSQVDTSQANVFFQIIEDATDRLNGKPVTISLLDGSGNLYTLSGTVVHNTVWTPLFSKTFNDTFTIQLTAQPIADGIYRYSVDITINATKTLTVRAVKLELGTVSTLSLDTAPNYATELLKCQRYFVRFGSATVHTIVGVGMVNSTGTLAWTEIDIPTDMRTTPAVTFSGANGRGYARFFGSQTVINYNSASTVVKSPNRLLVDFVPISGSTFTANAGGQICLAPNEFINITADL